jgi:hypothetical protein
MIHGELCPYLAKHDANAIEGPIVGTLEELCWVPFHVLGATKDSAILSKYVSCC